jgi:hypothetical protein
MSHNDEDTRFATAHRETLTEEQSNELLLARRLAEYVTLSGNEVGDELIKALEPFESPGEVSPTHIMRLRRAMRQVCNSLDRATVIAVLGGNSPLKASVGAKIKRLSFSGWITVLIGIVSIGLVVYLTHWETRGRQLLNNYSRYESFDYQNKMWNLVSRAYELQDQLSDQPLPDISSASVREYAALVSEFRVFFTEEFRLINESRDMILESARLFSVFNPANWRSWMSDVSGELYARWVGGDQPTAAPPIVQDNEVEAQIQQLWVAIEDLKLNAFQDEPVVPTEQVPQTEELRASQHFHEIENTIDAISSTMGRQVTATAYEVNRVTFSTYKRTIESNIMIANRVLLPVLYGVLGAFLFNIVRYLSVDLANPSFIESFLRIVFAAFAAITVSMLLIPSQIVDVGAANNPTIVYLFCFLFGYSINAFIRLLERLESFLSGRFAPNERGSGTRS